MINHDILGALFSDIPTDGLATGPNEGTNIRNYQQFCRDQRNGVFDPKPYQLPSCYMVIWDPTIRLL